MLPIGEDFKDHIPELGILHVSEFREGFCGRQGIFSDISGTCSSENTKNFEEKLEGVLI